MLVILHGVLEAHPKNSLLDIPLDISSAKKNPCPLRKFPLDKPPDISFADIPPRRTELVNYPCTISPKCQLSSTATSRLQNASCTMAVPKTLLAAQHWQ